MADRMYITPSEYRALPLGGVKNLGLKGDEILEHYIAIATANAEAFTERIFTSQEYTEVFRGDDSATFLTDNYPITKVTEIKQAVSGTTIDANAIVATTINMNCGKIELLSSTFSSGTIYSIKYTAGYISVPIVVKHAVALWVTELLQPDYLGPTEGQPDLVALSSQQISDLLTPLRRRRI